MLKILVTGKSGRMGQAVIDAAAAEPAVEVAATHDVGLDLDAAIQGIDCVIDFTLPTLTDDLLAAARQHGTRLVIGTTGLDADDEAKSAVAAVPYPLTYAITTVLALIGGYLAMMLS